MVNEFVPLSAETDKNCKSLAETNHQCYLSHYFILQFSKGDFLEAERGRNEQVMSNDGNISFDDCSKFIFITLMRTRIQGHLRRGSQCTI